MSHSSGDAGRTAMNNRMAAPAHVNNFAGSSNSSVPDAQPLPPTMPPPLPPRPQQAAQPYGGLGLGYSPSYYSPYGTSPFGGAYGGGLSGLGYGSSTMYPPAGSYPFSGGAGGVQDSQVSRIAEERTRSAFEPVENVVRTVSSLSFLLDSSFNAIFTSFRAVLSLADQFSQLKLQQHFQHLFATLSLLRLARWLWNRLKQVLSGQRGMPSLDSAWQSAPPHSSALLPAAHTAPGGGTDWTMVVLGGIAMLGPWLIWKLTSRLVDKARDEMLWASGRRPFYQAMALHDFRAGSSSELSLTAGSQLRIAPKELQPQVRGWLLASRHDPSEECGLVPANYVKLVAAQPGSFSAANDPVFTNNHGVSTEKSGQFEDFWTSSYS